MLGVHLTILMEALVIVLMDTIHTILSVTILIVLMGVILIMEILTTRGAIHITLMHIATTMATILIQELTIPTMEVMEMGTITQVIIVTQTLT